MYTTKRFGNDLKAKIHDKQNTIDIGSWAYTIYIDWPKVDDDMFLKLLLHLSTMELGPEFAFTHEELDRIADDLIAGKDVTL